MNKTTELLNTFIPRIIDYFKRIRIKIYDIKYERNSNGQSYLAIRVKKDPTPNSYIYYTCEAIEYDKTICNVGFHADKSINKEAQVLINSDLTPEIITFFETLENQIDYQSSISFKSDDLISPKKGLFSFFKK